jgi:hypothetical protein
MATRSARSAKLMNDRGWPAADEHVLAAEDNNNTVVDAFEPLGQSMHVGPAMMTSLTANIVRGAASF